LESILIIVLLAVIAVLLGKVAYKKSIVVPSNGNEWIALVAHKIKNAGDVEKACWDYEAPIIIEFVPIIGWDCSQRTLIPITPSFYNVWNRLNVNVTDKNTKYETYGFWLRDGIAFHMSEGFNIAYMNQDFWEDMTEYAFSGKVFEVRGRIPDCYRTKFAELFKELDHHRARSESQIQADT